MGILFVTSLLDFLRNHYIYGCLSVSNFGGQRVNYLIFLHFFRIASCRFTILTLQDLIWYMMLFSNIPVGVVHQNLGIAAALLWMVWLVMSLP